MKKYIFHRAFAFALFAAGCTGVNAQVKIGDNPTTINPNSVLELESSNKGLLLPRLGLDSTSSFAPLAAHVAGMVVYNTDSSGTGATGVLPGFYYNDGTQWVLLDAGGDAWQLLGNSGTTPPTTVGAAVGTNNYWGTADAKNLAVGTNGITRMLFDTLGNAYGGKNNIIANGAVLDIDNGIYPASSFIWGIDNVDSSYTNAIFGIKNKVGGSQHSNIIAGEKDTITGTWGWGNAVFGVKNSVTAKNGGGNVVGGIENRRVGTDVSSGNGAALFGYQNIDSSYFSSIVGGSNNVLGQGAGNSFVEGINNTITTPAFTGWGQGIAHSNGVLGEFNTILSSTSATSANGNTVAGGHNTLTDVNYSAVFGEFNKVVGGGFYGSTNVVGGGNNTVAASASAVFGNFNTDSALYTLVAGQNNTVSASHANSIVVGSGNAFIDRPNPSFVVGGGALFGHSNTGYGAFSALFGERNVDSSDYSIVAGKQNTLGPEAHYSIVQGDNNRVGRTMGGGGSSSGYNCAVFGWGNTIGYDFFYPSGSSAHYGNNVLVVGQGHQVGSGYSATIGQNSIMMGAQNSLVIGTSNVDSASNTLIMGDVNIIKRSVGSLKNEYSTVLGRGNVPFHNAQLTVGNGVNVGPGVGTLVRGNAFTVMKTGKVAMGNHTVAPAVALEINGTDAVKVPVGTTAQRPAAAQFGQLRYNTTTGRGEMYVNDVNGDGTQGDAGWRPF